MKNIKKYIAVALIFTSVSLCGCSKGIYDKPDKKSDNSDNIYTVQTNGVKKIISTSSDNIKKISKDIPGIKTAALRNGRYIVYSSDMTLEQLGSRLKGLNGITNIDDPTHVDEIKSADKTVIDKSFNLSINKSVNDSILNDPGYKYEWAVESTESNKAWSLVKQKRAIKVAVVDTGIDYSHPDLKNRILESSGYDFINNRNKAFDDNGHGTFVSGIIAAEANNKEGISGVAGPLNVKIIPVKVLNSKGEGDSDIIARGIMYAADKGADIINLSFTCTGKSSDIAYAIQYAMKKGCFVVSSAGDSGKNCDFYSPAGDFGSYTVSAVNKSNSKIPASNYGNSVNACAPGVSLISTVPGGNYESLSGTDASAAVVSGVAAIIKAYDSSIKPDKMKKILNDSAVDVMDKGKDTATGYGLVDAYKALTALSGSK